MRQPTEATDRQARSNATGSKGAPAGERVWRRFAMLFIGVFAGLVGTAYVFIILVDPYDSGRLVSLGLHGLYDGGPENATAVPAVGSSATGATFGDTDTSQRTSNVALGRSARFDAAIFGNSHGQLLSPERLSRATGLRFVQLTVPGSNVREQIAMMHWFIAHHAEIGALVLALDERWCVTNSALPLRTPFPFWLYGDSDLVYLANALSTRTLRDGIRRVAAAFGPPAAADPAGYADYETGKAWTFKPGAPASAAEFPGRDDRPFRRDPDFPALIRLDALLGEVPATTPVVIVLPPQFHTRLPPPGTPAARFRDYCKWQIGLRALRGPGSAFLDFFADTEIARAPENFMDDEHYRANVAEIIEADIAAALNGRASSEARHD